MDRYSERLYKNQSSDHIHDYRHSPCASQFLIVMRSTTSLFHDMPSEVSTSNSHTVKTRTIF